MDEAVTEEATAAASAIVQILTVGDRVLRVHHIMAIHHIGFGGLGPAPSTVVQLVSALSIEAPR